MSFFKKYIINGAGQLPASVYKRLILTGQLSIVAGLVSFIYILIESNHGEIRYVPLYGIITCGSIISLVLLKFEKHKIAKFTLLFSALIVVALFSSIEPYRTGVYMIYIVVSLGAFTLFGYEDLKLSFILVGLTVAVFIFNYFINDINFLGYVEYSEAYVSTSFAVNFFTSILSTSLMFYYILAINHASEREMKESQNGLINLTEELKASEARFGLVIKGSSAGIWDWNVVGSKIYVSPILQKLWGYDEGELEYIDFEQFLDFVHPEDLPRVNLALRNHIKNRKRFLVEARFLCKDGTYMWGLDSGQAEWDKNGNLIRMAGCIVDITERKEAEQLLQAKNRDLRKTNEELDKFVYSTSHDLKAPLCSMLGLIHIANISEDCEEKKQCMSLMKERVETLNGFIEDIISYSRNSRLSVMPEEVLLDEMIDKIFEGLQYFDQQKDISIIKCFPENLEISTDRGRLQIILNNLITNAIKYHNVNQENPFIKISVETCDDVTQINVEDNGHGIEDNYKEKIFNMFYRATENSDGSGLGLYIAREMVEKMRGQITVQSEYGKGSAFSIVLPNYFEVAVVA